MCIWWRSPPGRTRWRPRCGGCIPAMRKASISATSAADIFGRTDSFPVAWDRDHLVTALAYVDLNPVRAGMVGSAQLYPWSSARAHVEEEDPLGLIDFSLWRQVRGRSDWAGCLNQPPPSDATRRLREATQRGVPLGSEGFVGALEQSTGRCLALRGPGRPPRRKAHQASAG